MGGQRIGKRRHAGIEHTPRFQQRLLRLQHHGEFGEIEAPDIDQRAGALLSSNRYCMREGIAHFAQAHGGERRRQRQFRRERRSWAGRLQRHWSSLYLSYLNTYNYSLGRSRGQSRGRKDRGEGDAGMAFCLEMAGQAKRLMSPMAERPRTILICSCEDTMPLDGEAVRRACRDSVVIEGRQFCRAELERFRKAAAGGEQVTVACTQEAPLFDEIAGEIEGSGALTFVNIRETAGWSKDAAKAGPKMAALIAASAEPAPEIPFVPLASDGVTLLYGKDEQVIEAANLLKEHLDVTVLIKPEAEIAPMTGDRIPGGEGHIRTAKGYLGAFELTVDDYAAPQPLLARHA